MSTGERVALAVHRGAPKHIWYQRGGANGRALVPWPPLDVNVKNLEPDVVARLAEQAAAEGMSQQEWVRQVLRRTAARFSPAELLAQRESSEPMSDADFARIRKKAAARHKAAADRLGATGRRR